MNLIQAPVQDLFSTKGLQWLRHCTTDPELDADLRAALASDLRLLDAVQAELDALDHQLAALPYPIPQVKLLMTLPGVDYPTALALLAAWGTVERFNSQAQAASYLGLSPSTRQSDQHCYHGPITKHSNPHTR
jgi:transposase